MIDYELLKQTRAVFIADLVDEFSTISLDEMRLEMTSHKTYQLIMKALTNLCKGVSFYSSQQKFMEHIGEHQKDVVLSLWSGTHSHNRKALIPSICEANGICYVGADPYVHILSQDKKMAKEYCKQFGIMGAKDILVRTNADLSKLSSLHYPVVIKPNYEGGSIGVSNRNLVRNINEAKSLTKKLLSIYEAVLVEEYIQGYEICVCISGILGQIDVFEGIQTNFGGEQYITKQIYGYEYKKGNYTQKYKECATEKLTPFVKKQLLELYWSLGKVEVMRIDGRVDHAGEFWLIELSPDCSLSATASTAHSYQFSGKSYEEMIADLLSNALINQAHQNAKKI